MATPEQTRKEALEKENFFYNSLSFLDIVQKMLKDDNSDEASMALLDSQVMGRAWNVRKWANYSGKEPEKCLFLTLFLARTLVKKYSAIPAYKPALTSQKAKFVGAVSVLMFLYTTIAKMEKTIRDAKPQIGFREKMALNLSTRARNFGKLILMTRRNADVEDQNKEEEEEIQKPLERKCAFKFWAGLGLDLEGKEMLAAMTEIVSLLKGMLKKQRGEVNSMLRALPVKIGATCQPSQRRAHSVWGFGHNIVKYISECAATANNPEPESVVNAANRTDILDYVQFAGGSFYEQFADTVQPKNTELFTLLSTGKCGSAMAPEFAEFESENKVERIKKYITKIVTHMN